MRDDKIKRRTGYLYERQEATTASDAFVKEWDTYRCSHCDTTVVMMTAHNVALGVAAAVRERAREWCSKCDRYICDECYLLGRLCLPMNVRLDLCMTYQDGLPYLSPYLPDGSVHPGVLTRLEESKIHLLRS